MSSKNNSTRITIKRLTVTAVFTALIFIATSYIKIPIPAMGYCHAGDGLIFLAAVLLPTPYAIFAAAAGAGLADVAAAFVAYLPATIVLKSLTALCFSSKCKKRICVRNFIALGFALLINVGGYYLYESIFIAKNFTAPLAAIPFNIVQSLVGAVIFVALGMIFDKVPALSSVFEEIRGNKNSDKE